MNGCALRLLLTLAAFLAAALLAGCSRSSSAKATALPSDQGGPEIRWDGAGVPHIRADNPEELFFGFGWAQARSHGEMLLRLYGQARGRAAEYWGAEFLGSDQGLWTAGIPERSEQWLEQQSPEFRGHLEAFAAGVNAFLAAHPERVKARWRRALPITASDLLGHTQRCLHFGLVAGSAGEAQALAAKGSNAWAIAPARTAQGQALLLTNPHLPWSEPWRFFEAQLECPGYACYGVAMVGLPVLSIAFNQHLGWTHTLNTHDGADYYQLALGVEGYRLDGRPEALESKQIRLTVRREWLPNRQVPLTVESSQHGPLIQRGEQSAVALRVVGLDRPGALAQWWAMGAAQDLAAFERALALEQVPTFTVLYADRAGHVLHQFGGLTPRRAPDPLDWSGLIPGDNRALIWQGYHGLAELPRVLDPQSGFVHSANDPPWSATWPAVLDPEQYPHYLAPNFLHLAAQRSLKLLRGHAAPFALEDLASAWADCEAELAGRYLPELLPQAAASPDPQVREAGEVLARWDRRLHADSRGALLFEAFVQRYGAKRADFAVPFDPAQALETPRGLADPARALWCLGEAAAELRAKHGRLDASWGTYRRLLEPSGDLPASGGPRALGLMRAVDFVNAEAGRQTAAGGETYVAAIEFSAPPRALVGLAYDNCSEPQAPGIGASAWFLPQARLRPALLAPEEIEAQAVLQERLPSYPPPLP